MFSDAAGAIYSHNCFEIAAGWNEPTGVLYMNIYLRQSDFLKPPLLYMQESFQNAVQEIHSIKQSMGNYCISSLSPQGRGEGVERDRTTGSDKVQEMALQGREQFCCPDLALSKSLYLA